MKKFLCNENKKCQFFLFFLTYMLVVFPMEQGLQSIPKKGFLPQNSYTIFNPKKYLDWNIPWHEMLPGSLTITPDGKGVIIAENGRIRHQLLGMSSIAPELLFEHPSVKHIPMLTVAQKKDEQPLVVSAGNYLHRETKKLMSEYILFCKSGLFKIEKFDFPINAIKLNREGELLVIVSHSDMRVIDLKHNRFDRLSSLLRDNSILDIAINEDSTKILLAENKGIIHLCNVTRTLQDLHVSLLKQVSTGNIINEIEYPIDQKIIYSTIHGKAKIIDMYDFLENSPVTLCQTFDGTKKIVETYEINPIIGGNVKSSAFAHSLRYNSVILDQDFNFYTAHWSNDDKRSPDDRRRIKVYRKKNESFEKFILMVPDLEEEYEYIINSRQRRTGLGHLLLVALRGTRVVALGTNGKMYLWILPCADNLSIDDMSKKGDSKNDRPVRRRSNTFSGGELSCLRDSRLSNNIKKLSEEVEDISSSSSKIDSKSKIMISSVVHSKARLCAEERALSMSTEQADKRKNKKTSPRAIIGVLQKTSSGHKLKEHYSASKGNASEHEADISESMQNISPKESYKEKEYIKGVHLDSFNDCKKSDSQGADSSSTKKW